MENARKARKVPPKFDLTWIGLLFGMIIGFSGLPLACETFGPVRGSVISLLVGLFFFLVISLSPLLYSQEKRLEIRANDAKARRDWAEACAKPWS